MKVTIATGLYPPDIGGPATYAKMLESELPARGFELKILPFNLVRHHPKIIRHFLYFIKLWKVAADTDCVYALDPISVGLPSLMVAKLRRKTFMVRLGGDYAWEQGRMRFGIEDTLDDYLDKSEPRPMAVKILAKIQTYVVSKAEKVIVPSKYLKSVVAKWGIDTSKIEVIYSALYPLQVSKSKTDLRSELKYSHPTIVSAGRLVPWKGFEKLIEVVGELKNTFPNIRLVIAGSGDEMKKLEAKVLELDLSKNVYLAGSLSKQSLGEWIKVADVFVLNTAYEGLSHQLIEVMDIGTPIVTTNVGGNPELITNDVDGLLVRFNDSEALRMSILSIINQPELSERLVESARSHSKQFTKEIAIKHIESVLINLHGRKRV